jgi:two-component system sensor histidine kinase/response regulator
LRIFNRMPAPGFYPKPTILVVDDSPDTRAIIRATLNAGGFEAMVAIDGEDALRLIESFLPDVILLDIVMAGLDGLETCRRLRATPRTHALPVILMSSLADRDVVAKSFAAGAVDFLAKPFRGEELCARVAVHAELNRARRELEESHARLAELNAEKDQMFGVAAHDLRGPLTAILGFADHALKAPDHPEAALERHALEVVRREARQMNHYLEQLLDLNALERGGVSMRPRVLDLREMVRAAVERHFPRAVQKDITLRKEAAGELRMHVRADPIFLRQVLDNYLSNALKFTPPGGLVRLRVASRDGEAHVTVNDSGPGLSGEDMASAFKRFARLSARPTSGEKSTGLGLAICRALTQRMGGRVWCGNDPDGGACFGLALPAVSAEPAMDPKDKAVSITHPAIAREIAVDSASPFPFPVRGFEGA